MENEIENVINVTTASFSPSFIESESVEFPIESEIKLDVINADVSGSNDQTVVYKNIYNDSTEVVNEIETPIILEETKNKKEETHVDDFYKGYFKMPIHS